MICSLSVLVRNNHNHAERTQSAPFLYALAREYNSFTCKSDIITSPSLIGGGFLCLLLLARGSEPFACLEDFENGGGNFGFSLES